MRHDGTSPESRGPSLDIVREIQERGPITVAAFMDLALYHPEFGYYARAAQRSGRAGDFLTSVDVGPLFGELLEVQFEEMARLIPDVPSPQPRASTLDLVEAGAGNGRLSADILRAARRRHPELCDRVRLHLVEASAAARAAQPETLGDVADRLASSSPALPESFEGVLFANELLDAIPVHQVVMREDGLREVFVVARDGGGIATIEGEPSTPALAAYLDAAGVRIEPGARAEIGLAAVEWVRSAARRLRRGFLVLIDYGHDARELYSASHASGTLTTFARHTMRGSDAATPAWLDRPGEQDITAHVDFTSIRAAAEAEGCTTIGFLDQTYFLMGIISGGFDAATTDERFAEPRTARALRTLLMPGGLGSTQKVLLLGKGVGTPALRGCSYRQRVT